MREDFISCCYQPYHTQEARNILAQPVLIPRFLHLHNSFTAWLWLNWQITELWRSLLNCDSQITSAISQPFVVRFGCPLVSSQGLVPAYHTPKGIQIRAVVPEKSLCKDEAKKLQNWKRVPMYSPFFFHFASQNHQCDFSAVCGPIWLPFGVWQAVTKPWSDTKGHPNRCSSSREILFQTWDSEEVVILWWFFPTFLCKYSSWFVFVYELCNTSLASKVSFVCKSCVENLIFFASLVNTDR